mmetsp:Transcript_11836/g.34169  ORF Transcript_11836/g.34169 Transcript_11836/m.34169 type:complete len:242 (+) Transcript_11836:667-1392(+)
MVIHVIHAECSGGQQIIAATVVVCCLFRCLVLLRLPPLPCNKRGAFDRSAGSNAGDNGSAISVSPAISIAIAIATAAVMMIGMVFGHAVLDHRLLVLSLLLTVSQNRCGGGAHWLRVRLLPPLFDTLDLLQCHVQAQRPISPDELGMAVGASFPALDRPHEIVQVHLPDERLVLAHRGHVVGKYLRFKCLGIMDLEGRPGLVPADDVVEAVPIGSLQEIVQAYGERCGDVGARTGSARRRG